MFFFSPAGCRCLFFFFRGIYFEEIFDNEVYVSDTPPALLNGHIFLVTTPSFFSFYRCVCFHWTASFFLLSHFIFFFLAVLFFFFLPSSFTEQW